MNISNAGLSLLTEFEGVYTRPYNDPVGYATVGIGHLIAYRNVNDADRRAKWLPGQKRPGVLTVTEAKELLARDLGKDYEPKVEALVKVPITQPMFDALVSFAYNVGTGGLAGSTLLRKLNARDYRGAADQFGVWVKAGGSTLPGLVRRRAAEKALFLSAAPDPLTSTERRLVNELAKLRRKNANRKWDKTQRERADSIKKWIRAQMKRIRTEARKTGWADNNRRARYTLLKRAYYNK